MASENGDGLHVPGEIESLPRGWGWSRLDKVCEAVFDCPHLTPEVTLDGPLMVRTQDILGGVFRAEQAAHDSEATYAERTMRAEPVFGDLVYSREGTYFGIAAEIPPGTHVCLGQRMVLLRPNSQVADARYLRYWLNSPIMARHIHGYRDGTVAERLNLPSIRALPVAIAPKGTQRAIARILGALDDKIELNRRMNETLEGMARALFKSWFVDFDPVRAKLDGRHPPNLDPTTAALFPDRFEHTDLGLVPKGWRCGRLDDLLVLRRGFDLPAKDRTVGKYPVYSTGGHHGQHNEFMVKGPGVVTGRSGVLGQLFYVAEDFWPLNTTLWVKEYGASRPLHAYHLLSTLDFGLFNAGSAVPTLNRNHVHGLPQIVPPVKLVEQFELIAGEFFKCRDANDRESRTLAALRNALLPKLLSGEIRVPTAEKLVEEVA